MPDGLQLFDLVGELAKAYGGDPAARGRVLRNALPTVANLVRPGAGRYVRRGLELLDHARDEDGRLELGAGGGDQVGDFEGFIERLLATPYGFYVVVGEPSTGKTTLALRLAQRLVNERHYRAVGVGGFHPDDRRKWNTDEWIESAHPAAFLRAMSGIQRAMVRGIDYPRGITRRVILLDDASLIAHSGATRFNRALLQAWNAYRHMSWVLIVTARTFKSVGPVAENADALFIKRPEWDQLTTERPETVTWWRDADQAYRDLRRTDDWKAAPDLRKWVYARAPRLRYMGMMPYGGPLSEADDDDRPTFEADFVQSARDLDDDDDVIDVAPRPPRRARSASA